MVGVSASGKSTFARELAEKTGIPLVHMDAIMWRPGWQYVGDEETVARLDEESRAPAWIIEGYVPKEARPFVFERADRIIHLDYAPRVAALRYLRRWLQHRRHPRPELPGSPERFSPRFLKLVWQKGETSSLRRFLEDASEKVVTLSSPRQARAFLESL